LSKLKPSTFKLLHFTYLPMKEGCLFALFDCHVGISQVGVPLAALLVPLESLQ
jgi:hypothetical protein